MLFQRCKQKTTCMFCDISTKKNLAWQECILCWLFVACIWNCSGKKIGSVLIFCVLCFRYLCNVLCEHSWTRYLLITNRSIYHYYTLYDSIRFPNTIFGIYCLWTCFDDNIIIYFVLYESIWMVMNSLHFILFRLHGCVLTLRRFSLYKITLSPKIIEW